MLDLHPEIDALGAELHAAFERVLRSTAFINGPDVKQLEDEIAAYLGVEHAVGLNSGTDALVIALRALGVGPGDEVIVPGFTFFATAECVSMLGATPVFADVDPHTYNLSVSHAASLITPRTKAIIPVHLFGHAAEMDEVKALASAHSLKVVEDVAQAFSGLYKGRKLGTLGDVGAYSFFPSKNLGAYGDGGLLTTDDRELAETARMLRAHGAKKKYFNEVVGYNSRLDTLQAAILRVKLPRIGAMTAGRRAAAARYGQLLGGRTDLVLPVERPYATHCYHQYTVRLVGHDRDGVQAKLAKAGIETMVYYPVPLHRLPIYASRGDKLPVCEEAAASVISLPIWPEIPGDIQARVARELLAALDS
jgi:dTDP-4-amino-4,6-dideoxygalactose transaminase